MTSPLANRNFRRLFAAQTTALIGTGLASVALALLAYDLAGANAGEVLGIALAIKMIAYVAIAPLVGAAAHALPRRRLLVGLDLSRAVAVCLFPFVDAIWQVYALIFVISAGAAGFTPAFQATIPDILPDEQQYTRALSLSRLASDLENLLSPLIAAAALAAISYRELFTANALAFVISAALVMATTLPAAEATAPARHNWHSITGGIRLYFATARLRGLFALSLAVAAAGAMVIVNTVVYVRGNLAGSESDTAIALAAFGCGSMVTALVVPRLLELITDRPPMLAGAFVLAGTMLLGAASPGYLALLALWFAAGIGYSLILTPAGRLLQRSSAPTDRPALYAAQFALSHACWLITYPLAGIWATESGMTSAFLVMATICLLAGLAAATMWKEKPPGSGPENTG
ncbi:MAG: MFS transporter [Betaproteobacteria bacterium]|nr:MFS transporter [Betaproteobacteria bacterium]